MTNLRGPEQLNNLGYHAAGWGEPAEVRTKSGLPLVTHTRYKPRCTRAKFARAREAAAPIDLYPCVAPAALLISHAQPTRLLRCPLSKEGAMRATAIAAIAAATFVSHAAVAVKRHASIPEPLRGSWASSTEACQRADKSIIIVSAKTYTSSEANCTVGWVTVTAAARGPMYSAHLQCSKPEEKTRTQSDVIFYPKDNNQISIGSRLGDLKDYHRCSAREPATTR
jgi:hypothetical protein